MQPERVTSAVTAAAVAISVVATEEEILGVVTAIGGGLLRDILAGRKTLLMSHELYAIPVTLGCCVYVLILNFFPALTLEGSVLCMLAIFGLRAAAIYWDLRVPKLFITKTR